MFKEKNYAGASQKYFSAINAIRFNSELAKTKVGKETEMSCRSNLALCKLNVKEYEQVVDQCERVLDYDPQNTKAAYRMSQACFELSEGSSVS